jgi:hypothetical protein
MANTALQPHWQSEEKRKNNQTFKPCKLIREDKMVRVFALTGP